MRFLRVLPLALALSILGSAGQAGAVGLTLNQSFGSVPVSGDIVLSLEQLEADVVEIELDLTQLTQPTEYVKELYLNVVAGQTITAGSIPFEFDPEGFKAGGLDYFDLKISFPNGNRSRVTTQGSTYAFTLEGAGLTVEDFFDTADGGTSPLYAVAKVNGTGSDGEGSDWVAAVPEPSAALLYVAGLLVVGEATRRRR